MNQVWLIWCLGCSGCQVGWVVAGPHYSGPGNPVDGLKPAIKLGPDSCLSCLDREGYNKVAHNCSRFLTHLVDTLGLIKWIFFICSLSAFYGPVLSVARAGESAGVDTSIISLLIAGYPHLVRVPAVTAFTSLILFCLWPLCHLRRRAL